MLHKYGDLLYKGVRKCVKDRLAVICAEVSSSSDEQLLEVLTQQWEEHKLVMGMIRDILLYMVCSNIQQAHMSYRIVSTSELLPHPTHHTHTHIYIHYLSISLS